MKSADFKKIVTKELAPFLRQNKWKGTGFDYTSHIENIVNLFTIQPSSSGGKFCIEVGIHFDFLPLKSDKEFSKLKTWDVGIRKRLSPNEGMDYWWSFPSTDSEKTVLFDEIRELYLLNGTKYFEKYQNWKDLIPNITIENIEKRDTIDIFPMPILRTSLYLAQINLYLSNYDKATKFAEFGLSKIVGQKGSGLIPDFNAVVEKASR